MKKFFLLLVSITILVGCGKKQTVYEEVQTPPSASAELAEDKLATADNPDLPFEYRLNALMPTDKNYIFSPLSLKMSLSLAANGADGDTKQEINDLINVEDIEKFNNYEKQLISTYVNNGDIRITLANSLWINTDKAKDLALSEDYIKTIGKLNNAKLGSVNNENAVDTINTWCSQNTNNKIANVINSPDHAAFLVNALYFSGKWTIPFDPDGKSAFTSRDGTTKDIDFMTVTDSFNYYEDSEIKIVELPYGMTSEQRNSDTSGVDRVDIAMYLVLNNDRRMDLNSYMDILSEEQVCVTIPKFSIEYIADYTPEFKQLGIKTAFDKKKADFHIMFGVDKATFALEDIAHGAVISVDEDGTEAAAVTDIEAEIASEPLDDDETKQFLANKPFTFLIVDKRMNEVLFIGEYAYAKEE